MSAEYTETVFPVNGQYTVLAIQMRVVSDDYTGMEFCTNMRRLRKAKGWKQEDLAERMDVAQATITRWETGKREPAFADIEKIAAALEVSVADLFVEDHHDPLPSELDLAGMLQRSMLELPPGVSYEDFPQAVSSSLRDRLARYQAGERFDSSGPERLLSAEALNLPLPPYDALWQNGAIFIA